MFLGSTWWCRLVFLLAQVSLLFLLVVCSRRWWYSLNGLLVDLLLLLGFATRRLVVIRRFALNVTPNTIHQFALVATNLEILVTAVLIENAGGTVTQFFNGLDGTRIFDFFCLENFAV